MLIGSTINDALIELGVINPIDEASPQESEHALRTLNRIISLYNQQGLLIPYTEEITIAEPSGGWTRKIIIGHGQTIDISPPIKIEGAFFRTDDIDYSMEYATLDRIESPSYKQNQGYPSYYFYQKDNSNNMEIIFNYIPVSGLELHLLAKMPYTGTSANGYEYVTTDDIDWEYGFEKMLMTRLALELAPSYGIQPSQVLLLKAQEAENVVKSANYQAKTLKSSYGRKKKWAIPSRYRSY